MSLYAYEGEILIYAAEAENRKTYRCAGCSGQVRVRKGSARVPHFYHLSRAPSCRHYSKSEDHFLAQVALKDLLPEVQLEKSFPAISRIADVAWESRKIIFEIQCSLLSPKEVTKRMEDYKSVGYQVVWILDDRVFNRRTLRPAEKQMRLTASYYATIRKEGPVFYDQFEIFQEEKRMKRGHALKVRIDRPCLLGQMNWEKEKIPRQVLEKEGNLYFEGDLLHRALLSKRILPLAFSMENLCAQERFLKQDVRRANRIKKIVRKLILEPYGRMVLWLLEAKKN